MPPQVSSHQPVSQSDWPQFSFVDDHLPASQPDNGNDNHDRTAVNQPPISYSMHSAKGATQPSSASADHLHTLSRQHISSSNSSTLHTSQFGADSETAQDFSFADYLTPEFSSENHYSEQSNHTTPSVDELWPHDNQQDSLSVSHDSDSLALGNDHNGIAQAQSLHNSHFMAVSSHAALLTPEMSTASLTPERTFHPNHSHSHSNGLSVDVYDQRQSRNTTSMPYDQSHMNMYARPAHSPSPSEGRQSATSGRPMPHAISPVVMVSTYNRGDSPARPQMPMSRSNSKRSKSSRLGDQGDMNTAPEPQQSRLMPPVNLEEQWIDNNEDDEEGVEQHAGRSGIAPGSRDAEQWVPSINDMDQQQERDSTRADVEHWLATSEAGSPTSQEPGRSRKSRQGANRIRSRSTGTHLDVHGMPIFSDSHIPGPGVLIDEGSEYYYSDDVSTLGSETGNEEFRSKSPPADVNIVEIVERDSYFPDADDEIAPDELEPLPRQFYRRTPWQDPVRGSEPSTKQDQPLTSNAAMHFYEKQAARFETASRAATWGTRRRLSDSDINSILDGSNMTRHLSLKETFANKARARGSSILHSAKNMLPRRSSSFVKKHHKQASGQSSGQASPVEDEERVTSPGAHGPRASLSSIHTARRRSSFTKNKPPRSPPVGSTGGALLAMTGQLTAVGGSSVTVPQAPDSEPLKSPLLGALKRVRSRSDVAKSPKTHHNGGLSGLFKTHGGPPVPTLASPAPMREHAHATATQGGADDEDDDDDAGDDETGIKMELPIQTLNIVPTLEGFKTHARQLNPRLELYLVERIAHDQLKRYKKLVKNRVDHSKLVQLKQQCTSGAHCFDLGGKATILPPRTGSKDSGGNYAQFKVASGGDSDNEDGSGDVEGVVTPALFPPGIPLPPTTHLPAEFECPLCFTVKKFQKPSDWTKHVHEDVQPFSCTFPNCPEPKSFKRKADWVRHENERHRHLEWWKCSVQECAHVCYRKDNFVQHLVREHKMTEPKGKGQKSGTRARPASRTTQAGQQPGDFWLLVDSCRHENAASPRSEPCKFCNNVCSTWKKLSVHVGKHMEQIAMPTLQLAARQKVSPETVISPVEPLPQRSFASPGGDTQALGPVDPFPHSPYSAGPRSYQGSSAGQSPAVLHAHPQVHAQHQGIPTSMAHQPYYNADLTTTTMQPGAVSSSHFHDSTAMDHSYHYDSYDNVNNTTFMTHPQAQQGGFAQPAVTSVLHAPYQQAQIPRSQPLESQFEQVDLTAIQGTAQQHYFGNDHHDNTYMNTYGHDMAHARDGMGGGSHSGHASHSHTPGSTGQADSNMTQFYTVQQPGPSGQGYHY